MSDHAHGGEHHHVHIVPPTTYIKNLLVLMGLMILTVLASLHHFGAEGSQAMNLTVALVIALCKMSAILLIFMHVKYSSNIVRFFSVVAFGFMVIFFAFTFGDFVSRQNHFHSTFVANPYGDTPAPETHH